MMIRHPILSDYEALIHFDVFMITHMDWLAKGFMTTCNGLSVGQSFSALFALRRLRPDNPFDHSFLKRALWNYIGLQMSDIHMPLR